MRRYRKTLIGHLSNGRTYDHKEFYIEDTVQKMTIGELYHSYLYNLRHWSEMQSNYGYELDEHLDWREEIGVMLDEFKRRMPESYSDFLQKELVEKIPILDHDFYTFNLLEKYRELIQKEKETKFTNADVEDLVNVYSELGKRGYTLIKIKSEDYDQIVRDGRYEDVKIDEKLHDWVDWSTWIKDYLIDHDNFVEGEISGEDKIVGVLEVKTARTGTQTILKLCQCGCYETFYANSIYQKYSNGAHSIIGNQRRLANQRSHPVFKGKQNVLYTYGECRWCGEPKPKFSKFCSESCRELSFQDRNAEMIKAFAGFFRVDIERSNTINELIGAIKMGEILENVGYEYIYESRSWVQWESKLSDQAPVELLKRIVSYVKLGGSEHLQEICDQIRTSYEEKVADDSPHGTK